MLAILSGKQWASAVRLGTHLLKQPDGEIVQWDMFRLSLLRPVARLCPRATCKIELTPIGRESFHFPASSEQQQPQSIGCRLITVCVECNRKALEFFFTETTF